MPRSKSFFHADVRVTGAAVRASPVRLPGSERWSECPRVSDPACATKPARVVMSPSARRGRAQIRFVTRWCELARKTKLRS